jgi:hypothetical protein
MTELYGLATKVDRLSAVRKKYRELPEDPEEIVKFLRFAYDNPKAFFSQTRKRRFRTAERIFELAKNLKQGSVRNVAELTQTFRDNGTRTAMYGGLWQETEDHGPVDEPKVRDVTLIYAVQGVQPAGGSKEHTFLYALVHVSDTPFSAATNLEFRNKEIKERYDIPVRTYKGKPGTL